MNTADAAEALAMCSAYDNRTVSRVTAEAWAATLPDINLGDAKAAIIEHYATNREWIMPADIRDHVKAMRKNRMDIAMGQGANLVYPPESIDPDDIEAGAAWTRAYRGALGDGLSIEAADRVACATVNVTRPALEPSPRPVAPVIEAVARTMPRIPHATRKAS